MSNKKIHLSLSDEEVAKFDMLRNELGMKKENSGCGETKESDIEAFRYRFAPSPYMPKGRYGCRRCFICA